MPVKNGKVSSLLAVQMHTHHCVALHQQCGIKKLNKVHTNRNSTKWPNLKFIFLRVYYHPLCSLTGCWQMVPWMLLYLFNYCCSWHASICFIYASVYLANAGRMVSTELLISQFFCSSSLGGLEWISNAINSGGFNGKAVKKKPWNQRVICTSSANYFQLYLV